MKSKKMEILEELMEHLNDRQAGGLKSLLDEENSLKDVQDVSVDPESEDLEDGEPKGIAIEKVKVIGKPKDKMESAIDQVEETEPGEKDLMPGEEEMTDDELKELIAKHLS